MNQTVTDYEVVDHGIDVSQYFPGCGVAFTKFDHVVTGCGDDFSDALNDALSSMEQLTGFDTELLEGLDTACAEGGSPTVPDGAEDTYYYVSIRYNVAEESR